MSHNDVQDLAATSTGRPDGRALIVVDVQRDFCEGGALGVPGGHQVAERISQLLSRQHAYRKIVATRDRHIDPGAHFSTEPDFVDSWPPHCVVSTPGADFDDRLSFRDFAAIFDKGAYSAAYSGFEGHTVDGTSLADWLTAERIAEVEICGIATDHCVRATALDAARAGLHTTVLLDLTAAVSPDQLTDTIAALTAAGVTVHGTRP